MRRYLVLKCFEVLRSALPAFAFTDQRQELATYLRHIRQVWSFIAGPEMLSLVDSATVVNLELRVPAASTNDAGFVRRCIRRGKIFAQVLDPILKATILDRICAVEHTIPSLYSFCENTKYLEPCAKAIKVLLGLPIKGTIFKVLRRLFQDTDYRYENSIEQVSEYNFTKVRLQNRDHFEFNYQQLWMFAMRHFPNLVNIAPRKEPAREKPIVKEPNPLLWWRFARLALLLGFRSERLEQMGCIETIDQAESHSRSNAMSPNSGRVQTEDLWAVQDDNPLEPDPSLTSDRNDVDLQYRCRRPFENLQREAQAGLFRSAVYRVDQPRGKYITPFFVQRSTFLAFFGGRDTGIMNESDYNSRNTDIVMTGTEDYSGINGFTPSTLSQLYHEYSPNNRLPETFIASSVEEREVDLSMTNKIIPVGLVTANPDDAIISTHLASPEGEAQVESNRPSSNFSLEEVSKNQSSDQLLVSNGDKVFQAASRGYGEGNRQPALKIPVILQYEQNSPLIQSSTPENNLVSETDSLASAAMTRRNLIQLGTPPLGTENIVGEATGNRDHILLGSQSSITDTTSRISKVSLDENDSEPSVLANTSQQARSKVQAGNAPETGEILNSLFPPFCGSTAGSEDHQILPPFSFSNEQIATTDSSGNSEITDRPLTLENLSERDHTSFNQSPYLQASVDHINPQSLIQKDAISEPRTIGGKRIREIKNQDASQEDVTTEIWPHESANQMATYHDPPIGQERLSISRSRAGNSRPRTRVKRPQHQLMSSRGAFKDTEGKCHNPDTELPIFNNTGARGDEKRQKLSDTGNPKRRLTASSSDSQEDQVRLETKGLPAFKRTGDRGVEKRQRLSNSISFGDTPDDCEDCEDYEL